MMLTHCVFQLTGAVTGISNTTYLSGLKLIWIDAGSTYRDSDWNNKSVYKLSTSPNLCLIDLWTICSS